MSSDPPASSAEADTPRAAADLTLVSLVPSAPKGIYLAKVVRRIDWKRLALILLGLVLFAVMYLSPSWPDAVDPLGNHMALSREGKTALALFALAVTWWVSEVVPLGVTAIVVAAIQVLFLIRPARAVFTDFLDPAVWFVFGSLVIGMALTRTGLAKRIAYRTLVIVGERTSMIYLGCFLLVAGLTHVMPHAAVAAVVFPLFMSVHALYEEEPRPTRFGKGLFIGMAFTCAAGSIITLLGSARAPVAVGFFREIVGREIPFLGLTKFMLPLGWAMVVLIWLLMLVLFRPERKTISGLRERARGLHARLGPPSKNEILTAVMVALTVVALGLCSFVPALNLLDKSGIILVSTVLFFVSRILTAKDLEEIPWNIILLFGGAMSLGLCFWQTGAARWVALQWLPTFAGGHWLVLVFAVALFVLLMTNVVVNVAALAFGLPIAVVLAPYLGISQEVIFFSSLAAAGMPFLLLIGAAPNAIAYESRQFSAGEFFRAGVPASILLMLVLMAFVAYIWPLMGMPVTAR